MARVINGILGGFSGKVGAVIGVVRNGQCHMRGVPKKRTIPFTAGELYNQQKFRLVMNMLKPLKELLNVGFGNDVRQRKGLTVAISDALKTAVILEGDQLRIDPSRLKISRGSLPMAVDVSALLEPNGELRIKWGISESRFNDDQLLFLAYDPILFHTECRIYDGAFRKDLVFSINLLEIFGAAVVDIYIGFLAADRSAQSDSEYLGRFKLG